MCCFVLFGCACVCVSCLTDSLIDSLCVLIPVLPESLVVLFFPLFRIHLHPHSHPVPPPHSCVVFSLYPLHGFVPLPQCQGPGVEVTHHRRAAGLTEPPPSPPPSSALLASSLTSPSTLHLSSTQLRHHHLYAHANHRAHTHKHIICRKSISARLRSCMLVHINTLIHALCMHIHSLPHTCN